MIELKLLYSEFKKSQKNVFFCLQNFTACQKMTGLLKNDHILKTQQLSLQQRKKLSFILSHSNSDYCVRELNFVKCLLNNLEATESRQRRTDFGLFSLA